MEKLKKDFKADRTNWEAEKTTLLKRAEEAEAALKPVADELSGLKHQINTMTTAIFGKLPLTSVTIWPSYDRSGL